MSTQNNKTTNKKLEQSLKYKDLISKSQQQVEQEELDLQVQEAKSHVELTISQTKLDLAKASKALSQAQRAIPYSIQAEMDASEKVASLEEGLAFAEAILAERF